MVKLIRWNEKSMNRTNPNFSLTFVGKDTLNVFNELDGIDLGKHHISRVKDNFKLSDEQIKFIRKNGTTNFKVIRTNKRSHQNG